jgi:hypothetical protein
MQASPFAECQEPPMVRQWLLCAFLASSVLSLSACQQEAPKVENAVTKPANPADTEGWKKYVSAVVKSYVPAGQNARFFVTFAEANQDADKTARLVENTRNFLLRGVAEGTLLPFASPDSKLMADIVEKAFAEPQADKLKGSKVLFIGSPEEQERVKAAVTPWGAEFVFHEAK